VKAQYNGQNLLSHISLFENGTWNNIVQSPKKKIVKKKFNLKLILNDQKYILIKKLWSSQYITKCKYTSLNHSNDYQTWWNIQSYITYDFIVPFQFYMESSIHMKSL
jgi:hypothetical protein